MTLFSLRKALALLVALSLASCGGGGDASYPITGTVSGLVYEPLVLTAAGQTLSIPKNTANTATTINVVNYSFPKSLSYGDPYLVALSVNPPHQTCQVGQSVADSAGHTAAINIAVACTINAYYVSGYVTGLVGELQLINGSTNGTIILTKDIVDAAATAEEAARLAALNATPSSTVYTRTPSFSFPATAYDQSYGVTVLKQPDGQTCTVTNGSGKVGDGDVLTIAVKCVNTP